MLLINYGRPPKGHDAIADVLVQCPVVFLDDIGNGSEVEVDGRQHFAGALIEVGFSRIPGKVVLADI